MKLRQPVWFRFGGWQAPVLLGLLALSGAAPAAGQEDPGAGGLAGQTGPQATRLQGNDAILLAQSSLQELKESLGQRKPSSTPAPSAKPPLSPQQQQALDQAASACQQAYVDAYDKLLKKKRQTIEKAKLQIPNLQSCITQSRAMVTQGRQTLRDLAQPLADIRAQIVPLEAEIAGLKARRTQAQEKPAGINEVNPFIVVEQKLVPLEAQLSNKKATEAELVRKTGLMEQQVNDQLRKQILCEADLPILRERISAAEAALADRVPKLFEIHKQKRFAEIRQMQENRDLGAMQRCAERGYMDLDDVLRNVYD